MPADCYPARRVLATSRLRYLVVVLDEDEVLLATIEQVLSDAGYPVVTTTSVPLAQKAARMANAAVLLLGSELVDGAAACFLEELDAGAPGLATVMISSVMPACQPAGVCESLGLPMDPGLLLATIEREVHRSAAA